MLPNISDYRRLEKIKFQKNAAFGLPQLARITGSAATKFSNSAPKLSNAFSKISNGASRTNNHLVTTGNVLSQQANKLGAGAIKAGKKINYAATSGAVAFNSSKIVKPLFENLGDDATRVIGDFVGKVF